jgi:electron transport complex protein RnfD
LIVVGTLFAIVVAKHLYGGLGQNPFNPAMVAFAACIVSFPALMSQWPALGLKLTLRRAVQHHCRSGATDRRDERRDPARCAQDRAETRRRAAVDVPTLLATQEVFGNFAGRGWEWVSTGYLLGGLWLWQRKIITWLRAARLHRRPRAAGCGLWLWNPQQFADPLFHLFSGGAMLGAFFIVTDPVSGCTTNRGKLIFGFLAGAGLHHPRLRRLSGRRRVSPCC